ncbi:hypothetical protein AVEN_275743-1 [Araneus ventricosus]|uniref:Uncharacterized protein n=1 Tax=Araneus ventricosus TaxID=182803 RepID=A0A4Y2HMV4_ARAVE|nr:hypothetical protein AVEN_275743-1 [Araneus ventricosus]
MVDRIHSYFGPFVIRQHRVGFEFSPPSYVLEGSRNLAVVIANGAEFLKFLKRFLMDSAGFEDIIYYAARRLSMAMQNYVKCFELWLFRTRFFFKLFY